MRIIAFVLDRPVIERILEHIGEPPEPPVVLPARSPPQGELPFDQTPGGGDWPDMDQSASQGDGWERAPSTSTQEKVSSAGERGGRGRVRAER